MRKDLLRLFVGVAVIVAHVASIVGIVVVQQPYIPDATERIDVALLLVPISAAYVVAVVRASIEKQSSGREPATNLNHLVITILITLVFCIAVVYISFSYPAVFGPTVVELRRWLILLEIGFGVAFGLIAEDLFGKVERIMVNPPSPNTDHEPKTREGLTKSQ